MVDRPPGARHGPAISRRGVLGLAGTGVLAALTGCARGTYTRPAPPGVVTLNNDVGTWDDAYTAASEVLERRTGHRLAVRAVPDSSSYQQIVRMSAQTDSATDLIKWWNGYRLQDIARAGALDELTDAWDRAEAQGWVSPGMRESFSFEGRPYGLPLYKSYYAMFYSKRAFAKAGVRVPSTFDELLGAARALREAGITPIGSTGASTWDSIIWFSQLLIGLDPGYYQRVTEGRAGYLDDTAKAAMRLWSQMYREGLFSAPDIEQEGYPGMVADGTLGMALQGTFEAISYLEKGLDSQDVGLFLVPPADPAAPSAIVVESAALCVTSGAHKPDAAHAVADAWLATDVQQAWVDVLGDASANPAALPTGSPVVALAEQVARDQPQEVTRYWEASPPVLVEGNVQDLSSFMVSPTEADGMAALRSMQERAEREWELWKA